jgi:hypothetical protein
MTDFRRRRLQIVEDEIRREERETLRQMCGA